MLTGAVLERFHVKAPLARGGMGELYLAADEDDGVRNARNVVLKTVRQDMRDDSDVRVWFRREIDVTARLHHEHIVQHVAHGEWRGVEVLALEHIAGRSVAAFDNRRVPECAALCVAYDIMRALAYVHGVAAADGAPLGLVHGDVSPQNILVDTNGRAHLIDFGAATTPEDRHADSIVGKPGYLSPEQSRGELVDERSDQYSLGIVLWEMLAGRSLFEGSAARRGREVPSLVELAEVSEEVDAAVRRMLAYDAAGRFASSDGAASALAALGPSPSHVATDCADAFAASAAGRVWLAGAASAPRRARPRQRLAARVQRPAPQATRPMRRAARCASRD